MDDASPPPEKPAVAGSPSDFLKNIVGKKVKVRIGNGLDYHGEFPISCLTSRGRVGESRLGSVALSWMFTRAETVSCGPR